MEISATSSELYVAMLPNIQRKLFSGTALPSITTVENMIWVLSYVVGATATDYLAFCILLDQMERVMAVTKFQMQKGVGRHDINSTPSEPRSIQPAIERVIESLCDLLLEFFEVEARTSVLAGYSLDVLTTAEHPSHNLTSSADKTKSRIRKRLRLRPNMFGVFCNCKPRDGVLLTQILRLFRAASLFSIPHTLAVICNFFVGASATPSGRYTILAPVVVAFWLESLPLLNLENLRTLHRAYYNCVLSKGHVKSFLTGGGLHLTIRIAITAIKKVQIDSNSVPQNGIDEALLDFVALAAVLTEHPRFLQSSYYLVHAGSTNDVAASTLVLGAVIYGHELAKFQLLACHLLSRFLTVFSLEESENFLANAPDDLRRLLGWRITEDDVASALMKMISRTEVEAQMKNRVLVRIVHSNLLRVALMGLIDKGIPEVLQDHGLMRMTEYVYRAFEERNDDVELITAMESSRYAIMFTQGAFYCTRLVKEALQAALFDHAVENGSVIAMNDNVLDALDDVESFLFKIEQIIEWIIISLQQNDVDVLYYGNKAQSLSAIIHSFVNLPLKFTADPRRDVGDVGGPSREMVGGILRQGTVSRFNKLDKISSSTTLHVHVVNLELFTRWAKLGFRPYARIQTQSETFLVRFARGSTSRSHRSDRSLVYDVANGIVEIKTSVRDLQHALDVEIWLYLPFWPKDLLLGHVKIALNPAWIDQNVCSIGFHADGVHDVVSAVKRQQSKRAVQQDQADINLSNETLQMSTHTHIKELLSIIRDATDEKKLIGSYEKHHPAHECEILLSDLEATADGFEKAILRAFETKNVAIWSKLSESLNIATACFLPDASRFFLSQQQQQTLLGIAGDSSESALDRQLSSRDTADEKQGRRTVEKAARSSKAPMSTLNQLGDTNEADHRQSMSAMGDWRVVLPHVSIWSLPDARDPRWQSFSRTVAPTRLNHFLLQPIERLQVYCAVLRYLRTLKSDNVLVRKIWLGLRDWGEKAAATPFSLNKKIEDFEATEATRAHQLRRFHDMDPFDAAARLKRMYKDAGNLPAVLYREGVVGSIVHGVIWLVLVSTVWRLSIAVDTIHDSAKSFQALWRTQSTDNNFAETRKRAQQLSNSKPCIIIFDQTNEGETSLQSETRRKHRSIRHEREIGRAATSGFFNAKSSIAPADAGMQQYVILMTEQELRNLVILLEGKSLVADIVRVWPPENGNIGLGGFWSKSLFTVASFGSPFVLLYVVTPYLVNHSHAGWLSNIACAYGSFWLVLALISIMTITRKLPAFREVRHVDTVNLTTLPHCLRNYVAIVNVVWEIFQLNTTSFSVWKTTYKPAQVAAVLATIDLQDVGLGTIRVDLFESKQTACLICFLVWFFCLKASNKFKSVQIINYVLTFLLPNFLGGPLFMFLSKQFYLTTACRASPDTPGEFVLWANANVTCWQGEHLSYALRGLFGMGTFIPLAVLAYGSYQVFFPEMNVDVQTAPLINVCSQIVKAAMMGALTFFNDRVRLFLGVTLGGNLLLLFLVIKYRSGCSTWQLKYFKVFIYSMSSWSATCALISTILPAAVFDMRPLYTMHVGWSLLFIGLAVFWHRKTRKIRQASKTAQRRVTAIFVRPQSAHRSQLAQTNRNISEKQWDRAFFQKENYCPSTENNVDYQEQNHIFLGGEMVEYVSYLAAMFFLFDTA
ncbi:TPA: hypothetical protein N0F65_012816, partial [Lagenidium giganteum]